MEYFIGEQGATGAESFWKGATNHKMLRTTRLKAGIVFFTAGCNEVFLSL